jgi:hypothetical protein
MKPLYELTTEYRSILDRIDEMPDEEIDSSLYELLDSMKLPIEQKAINTAAIIKNLDHYAEGLKQAEDAIKARRKTVDNKIERIKSYLLDNMQRADISKINSPQMDIMVRNSQSVDDFSPNLIPEKYWKIKTERTLDKMLIKSDIKSGIEVQGAKLKDNKNLVIK